MKNGNIIQLVVIIVALASGIAALQLVVSGLFYLLQVIGAQEYGEHGYSTPLYYLALAFVNLLVCWLLVTRSAPIANFIYERAQIQQAIKIVTHPADLLYVLLVATGLYLLVTNIPSLLLAIWTLFSSKATNATLPMVEGASANWTILLLKIFLPAILLMFAKPISLYFAANVTDAPIEITDDPEYIETTPANDN